MKIIKKHNIDYKITNFYKDGKHIKKVTNQRLKKNYSIEWIDSKYIIRQNYNNDSLISKKYYYNNLLHRDDDFAVIYYLTFKNVLTEHSKLYFNNGKVHNLNGPAHIMYNESYIMKHWYIDSSIIVSNHYVRSYDNRDLENHHDEKILKEVQHIYNEYKVFCDHLEEKFGQLYKSINVEINYKPNNDISYNISFGDLNGVNFDNLDNKINDVSPRLKYVAGINPYYSEIDDDINLVDF